MAEIERVGGEEYVVNMGAVIDKFEKRLFRISKDLSKHQKNALGEIPYLLRKFLIEAMSERIGSDIRTEVEYPHLKIWESFYDLLIDLKDPLIRWEKLYEEGDRLRSIYYSGRGCFSYVDRFPVEVRVGGEKAITLVLRRVAYEHRSLSDDQRYKIICGIVLQWEYRGNDIFSLRPVVYTEREHMISRKVEPFFIEPIVGNPYGMEFKEAVVALQRFSGLIFGL